MCYALCLTLSLSLGLLLLPCLLRGVLHARLVRRVGVATPVLVGRAEDLLLPQRVYAAFSQNRCAHLEPCGGVVVLDYGVSDRTREACLAALGGAGRVVFLPPEKLCDYLVASAEKK